MFDKKENVESSESDLSIEISDAIRYLNHAYAYCVPI